MCDVSFSVEAVVRGIRIFGWLWLVKIIHYTVFNKAVDITVCSLSSYEHEILIAHKINLIH